jgi:hypothetical protein
MRRFLHRPRTNLPICVCFALGMVVRTASADPITFVPIDNSNNVFPFGYTGYIGEYQQVYRGSRFPSPVVISAVSFTFNPQFIGAPNIASTVTSAFSLGLSTTTAGPVSLSSRYADNIGSDRSRVFAGTIAGVATEPFSFRIPFETPFAYDPAAGNLLLDVIIRQNVTPRDQLFPFAFGTSFDMGRVFNLFGNSPAAADENRGLLTRFEVATPTPEPASAVLVGICLAGFLAASRRRRERLLPGSGPLT